MPAAGICMGCVGTIMRCRTNLQCAACCILSILSMRCAGTILCCRISLQRAACRTLSMRCAGAILPHGLRWEYSLLQEELVVWCHAGR